MRTFALIVAAGIAAPAFAQSLGSVVFTDNLNKRVGLIDGGVSTLYSFGASDRPAGIEFAGGAWWVAEGDQFAPSGQIIRIDDLFGAPSASVHASGSPLDNPIGIQFDRGTSQILTVTNPEGPNQGGIVGTDLGGASTSLFNQVDSDPRARFNDGAEIQPDRAFGGYLVTSGNGGAGTILPSPDGEPSSIWRFDPGTNNLSLVADLSATPFGAIHQLRGVTSLPGGDIAFTDQGTNAIYRAALDGSGVATSISLIADGLAGPHRILWNRYTGMLVFSELDGDAISEIAVDGTGYNVLGTGMDARGLYIVPAPSVLGALGLGGLALARRRR